jgi:hypothetical protein
VSWRITAFVLALFGLSAFSVTAQAHSSVVAKKSTRTAGSVYLSHALQSGHVYRLKVIAGRNRSIVGDGTEYFTYVAHKQLHTGSRSFAIHGKAPLTLAIRQPMKGTLGEWDIATTVQVQGSKGLTLKIVDLGRQK